MQTEHKGEGRDKPQVTSEKSMANTWKTGRTWEGCLEEVECEDFLKGKYRTCPQARLCQFSGGILGSDGKKREHKDQVWSDKAGSLLCASTLPLTCCVVQSCCCCEPRFPHT